MTKDTVKPLNKPRTTKTVFTIVADVPDDFLSKTNQYVLSSYVIAALADHGKTHESGFTLYNGIHVKSMTAKKVGFTRNLFVRKIY